MEEDSKLDEEIPKDHFDPKQYFTKESAIYEEYVDNLSSII